MPSATATARPMSGSIMMASSDAGKAARIEAQRGKRAETNGKEKNIGHDNLRMLCQPSENSPESGQISIGKFGPIHKEKIRNWPFAWGERATTLAGVAGGVLLLVESRVASRQRKSANGAPGRHLTRHDGITAFG